MPPFFSLCQLDKIERRSFTVKMLVKESYNTNKSKKSDTTPPNHTKTNDVTPNEETPPKKHRQRKKISNIHNDPCQTSSFIQHILSEDSKTNVAVVDLFVAVKTAKDNLDFLAKKNDDVLEQINTLKTQSFVVMNEYRNLAQDMRSFLDELNDETTLAMISDKYRREENLPRKVQENSVCASKCSKTSVECLDCIEPFVPKPPSDQSNISTSLLGSFLASILWLKKQEITPPKSLTPDKLGKLSVSDSTLQVLNEFCEIFGGVESDSEEEVSPNEAREPNTVPLKVPNFISKETLDSDSELEMYATPPPTPPPIPSRTFFHLKPKISVNCMGDLTKDKKRNVSTGTERVTHSVTTQVTEDITSTCNKRKKKKTRERNQKFTDAVDFKTDGDVARGANKDEGSEILRSCSDNSLDTYYQSDSDERETKSLSSDELEEFLEITNSQSILKTDSPSPGKDNIILTNYKIAKPTFFEVWKRYPQPFMQEIISRRIKMKQTWEVEDYQQQDGDQIVTLVPGVKQEKEIVIETSSVDLVVYIQVEVEEDDEKEQNIVDLKIDAPGIKTYNALPNGLENEKAVRSNKTEMGNKVEVNEKVTEKEREKKTVTFGDEVSEIIIEKKVIPEPKEVKNEVAMTFFMKEPILRVEEFVERHGFQFKSVTLITESFYRPPRNVELDKALELIREIEQDVTDTKLSDAISILPRLESELRKHIKSKVKTLGELECEKSVESFFSAFDVCPPDAVDDASSGSAGDRLDNLLNLLRDLEKAVKITSCRYNSSKIYGLLHALTESIRELEECSNVTSLSQTLDIASQLDTAVRQCEGDVKRYPMEDATLVVEITQGLNCRSSEVLSERGEINSVRQKVFQLVEEEAVDTEARLEKDTEKLDRLERENDEAMKFVEAFLEKTQRRATELTNIKTELKELSENLKEVYEELDKSKMSTGETVEEKPIEEEPIEEEPIEENIKEESSDDTVVTCQDGSSHDAEEATSTPVAETVSCLLLALDNLKSKAKKKKEFCREILSNSGFEKEIKDLDSSTRCSRSSFTAKNVEDLYSQVRDFEKIGDHCLYMCWTKPEGSLADSIVGYEIFVNGKLNQKVRNPRRLQAILYSIDLSKKAEVLLYGLLDTGVKIFLSNVTYVNVM